VIALPFFLPFTVSNGGRPQAYYNVRLDNEEKMRIKKCKGKEEDGMLEEEKTDKTETDE
jgi:hypothetical protein